MSEYSKKDPRAIYIYDLLQENRIKIVDAINFLRPISSEWTCGEPSWWWDKELLEKKFNRLKKDIESLKIPSKLTDMRM